ncbi:heme-binding protein 2-like [Asterias rubens]|uniref:heme-binding protein 2-like n=1 Tax=Asterias rubens TaxID=7604 RepID=UPI00145585EE|nr:heme-binding protein 2-like [Asterias rubens]
MESIQRSLVLLVIFTGFCSCYHLKEILLKKESQTSPDFCRDLDCPKFTETFTSKEYSIRQYEPSAWASIRITGIDNDAAGEEAFFKLFSYIQGANENGTKIPMTDPVTCSILPGAGPVCASDFTFSFMIPFKFQKDTPKPTNPDIKLTKLEAHTVYVREYSGFSNQTIFPKEAAALAAALNSSQTYNETMYYTAGYDSPFVYRNRHNEIWFFATNSEE